MSQPSDKTALRTHLRALRCRLAAEASGAAEAAARALSQAALPTFPIVALYHPMGSEMDPFPLLPGLFGRGQSVALPVATTREAPLQFRLWSPDAALVADAFGIPAPGPQAEIVRPDMVIAPVLGFDAAGSRLGQGAGHYDRTLQALRAEKTILVVGLAYAGQEVAALPAETHDQRLDAILTETGYRTFV